MSTFKLSRITSKFDKGLYKIYQFGYNEEGQFTTKVDSIFDAVASFAEWSKTKEGLQFWIEVSEAIDHDEIDEEKINELLNP